MSWWNESEREVYLMEVTSQPREHAALHILLPEKC